MRTLVFAVAAAGVFAFAGLEAIAQSAGSGSGSGSGSGASTTRSTTVKKKRICKAGYYLTKSNKCLRIKKTVRRSEPKGSH